MHLKIVCGAEHDQRVGFSFHHKASTDGVDTKQVFPCTSNSDTPAPHNERKIATDGVTSSSCCPGRKVGLDPGKHNIVTMICERGKKLRFTAKQRVSSPGTGKC